MKSSRRRSIFTLIAAFGTLLLGGALYGRLRAQETSETTQIAPGVSMRAVSTQTLNGPLRYWLIKADRAAAKLALEVADGSDVTKKKSVRELATQAGALVAVNGGFFAYEGAAVGAVKVESEWQRLPWKSRTALGWDENDAQIGSLAGSCQLTLTLVDGTKRIETAALNGLALPGTHTPLTDGFAVLTRRFGARYTPRNGEVVFLPTPMIFSEGHKKTVWMWLRSQAKDTAIPTESFLIVARGKALETLPQIQRAEWKVAAQPPVFDSFPNILGAGPLLVRDGVVKTTEVEEEFRPDVVARGPRTGVGFDAQGNTLLLVVNGWEIASVGLTIPETAVLFRNWARGRQ